MQDNTLAHGSSSSSGSRRPFFLFGILVLLVGATSYLLPQDPVIAMRISALLGRNGNSARSRLQLGHEETSDPALGSQLPVTGPGAEIRKTVSPSSRGYLVVGLGDCMGCIKFDFRRWQQDAAKQKVVLVGFSSGSPQHIAEFRQSSQITVPIIQDTQSMLGEQINAYWSGRLYYYDSNWRLRWIMHGLGNPEHLDKLLDLNQILENKR